MDRHGLSALAMTRVDVAGMRVGYYEPVDRHGLSALAMTRWEWVRGFCHCEERAERGTRQSIVSRRMRTSCPFGYWLTVDRHGLLALAMKRQDRLARKMYLLSLRGGSVANDAAIHRVSEDANGNCGLFTPPLSLFSLQSSLFYLLNQSGSPRALPSRWQGGAGIIREIINKSYFFPYFLWDSSTRSPSTY